MTGTAFDLHNGANLLRILCGVFLLPHLVVKFRNQDFVKGFMDKAGLRPPLLWLYASFVVEIVASIGLIFGVYTRYVAVLAGVFLARRGVGQLARFRRQMDVELRRARSIRYSGRSVASSSRCSPEARRAVPHLARPTRTCGSIEDSIASSESLDRSAVASGERSLDTASRSSRARLSRSSSVL